jgi:hypothetical protein
MVMARELYALLTLALFCLPIDPGPVVVYIRPVIVARQTPDPTPLTRMEQATIKTTFSHQKHYYMSMKNIKHACFTALDARINDAFKLSVNPAIQGSHAGMRVIDTLDQLSAIYGQPTPAVSRTTPHTTACIWLLMLPRSSLNMSKTALRSPSLDEIPIQIVN